MGYEGLLLFVSIGCYGLAGAISVSRRYVTTVIRAFSFIWAITVLRVITVFKAKAVVKVITIINAITVLRLLGLFLWLYYVYSVLSGLW
jgi:hypothetical protein